MKEIIISGNLVKGSIRAPSSKSHFIRLLAAACYAEGESQIQYQGICADVRSAMSVCKSLGANIREENGRVLITGKTRLKSTVLNCGESGLCLRMFSPLAALEKEEVRLEAEGSLQNRPVGMIEEGLKLLSVQILSREGRPPVWIQGSLKSGNLKVDGSQSSQFISGLLMALPQVEGNSILSVINPSSVPYLDMTIETLRQFGIEIQSDSPSVYRIPGGQVFNSSQVLNCEGDWSAAANFFVAGAIAGDITITGLSDASRQADKAILDALAIAGVKVEKKGSLEYRIHKQNPRAFKFDLKHQPDLAPPLVVLALAAEGISELRGIDRLHSKESDRAVCLQKEFCKMGADIQLRDNSMWIQGGRLKPSVLETHNDHRLAMAFGVAALITDGDIHIKAAEAVNKSYPGFFSDLEKIGFTISD